MKINGTAIFLLIIAIAQFTPHAYAFNPPPMKWNKTYGGDSPEMAYSAQQTNDYGYVIAGYTSSFGAHGTDFWLVKTDPNGNTQWNRTYGGLSGDEAYSVKQTNDGGYILAGNTNSFSIGFSDFWLVKTNSDGEMVWNKTYGGIRWDIAYSVQETIDGGYIAAGSTNSFGSGYEDFYLVKTDANGIMQWNKTYGGLYDDIAYSIQQTSDGKYVVCGYTSSFGAGYEDFWLLKIDSVGNVEWNKTYGGENSEFSYCVQQTSDNGYIIAGSTYSLETEFDIYLVKTDSSGNMQWNKTYGGSLDEEAYAVQQTSDGGYILAGFTDSFSDNRDIWLIKTDPSGNIEWSQAYGGAEKDEAYAIQQTSDGGYTIAGTTYSFGPSWDPDFWLIRLAALHDITIKNVALDKNVIGKGYSIFINVTIKNWGMNETFNVSIYANTTNIGTQLVTLTSGNITSIIFSWNTTTFAEGNYTIGAYAWPIPGETDIDDNNCTDSWALVTKVGDLGGEVNYIPTFFACDGKIDGYDLALFIACYKGPPQCPPNARYLGDLGGPINNIPTFFKCDEKVDGIDLALFIDATKD